jgi:hypothetical protein
MQISSQSLAHRLEIIQETGESWNVDKQTKHEILAPLNTRKLNLKSGSGVECSASLEYLLRVSFTHLKS